MATECVFTTECIAGETCTDTDFQVSMERDPDVRTQARLVTEFGIFQGLYSNSRGNPPENVVAFLRDTGDSYHLSWTETSAWLTLHMPSSDLAITYLGQCGENT
ncbi:MAG: hypothetical protein ACPG5U_06950 [Planktomarina sp.]